MIMVDPFKKETKWNRFIDGMKNLTVAQQCHAQMVGNIGTMVGICFAWYFMVLRGLWYFGLIMFFALWLQGIALVGSYQKWKQAKSMEEQISSMGKDWEKVGNWES